MRTAGEPGVVGAVTAGTTQRATGRALGRLWAATAVGGFGQSLAGAAGALLARQVGGSDAVAGLPQAVLVAGSALGAVALSALTPRLGRGRSLALGSSAAVVGCGIVVLAGVGASLVAVLVGTLLIGSGSTAVMLARYAAADLAAESARARAMATVLVATTVGAVAGPNLLASSAGIADAVGLPALCGPYLLAGVCFAVATAAFAAGTPADQGRSSPLGPSRGSAVAREQTPLGRVGASGVIVLALANLVMVAVTTMAPVHLAHAGAGLAMTGFVVSLHIAGMFAPSPVSGWLTDRIGASSAAGAAGVALGLAATTVGIGVGVELVLVIGLVLLGVGWNLALISGSALLTAGVPAHQRPRREAWGEVSMGVAAAGGGAASGPLVAGASYGALALAAAVIAVVVVPIALRGSAVLPGVGRRT